MILKDLPFEFEPEHVPDRAAAAVRSDQVIRGEPVAAPGCLDADLDEVAALRDGSDPGLPAEFGERRLVDQVDEVFLDVVLLQVDEGRVALAADPAAGRS
jgi:hypothetical protein